MKRQKGSLLLIVLLIFVLFLGGCGSDGGSVEDGDGQTSQGNDSNDSNGAEIIVLEGAGNSPSNLLHQGMAIEYEGHVYHVDKMFEGSIWKTSMESGESQLLLEGTLHHLNVNGGLLFAVGSVAAGSDGLGTDGIFMSNIDGSGFTVLKEGYFGLLILQDEYLYFTDVVEGGLYRMKYDGSEETLILENIYDNVAIFNDHIYVMADLDEQYVSNIYELFLDGSGEPVMIVNDVFGGTFDVVENELFYILRDNMGDMHRYDTEKKTERLFLDTWVDNLNGQGTDLYYFWSGVRKDNTDKGLYYFNDETGEKEMILAAESIFDINMAGGKIYWHDNDAQRRISVMNIDGTDREYVEQAN
ncbi:DUF5050 domain-containing protein [Alkalibacter mobilis]|uniref:DUF5050 domain-containing protein n=1 Tax=Alkalibacter mobilis TaxID=2787712 RepID=UPI00189E8FFF|nr:DUF5050 domain-containing protein [Alkalibacter mobilis]MBF7097423.1 DUF5050 domain-containing protein [Alkalibacter mobilis]